MAEAREAVNKFGHVIGTEAGEGEVEEGNVREGRSPALRHVQAERVGGPDEQRGSEELRGGPTSKSILREDRREHKGNINAGCWRGENPHSVIIHTNRHYAVNLEPALPRV